MPFYGVIEVHVLMWEGNPFKGTVSEISYHFGPHSSHFVLRVCNILSFKAFECLSRNDMLYAQYLFTPSYSKKCSIPAP